MTEACLNLEGNFPSRKERLASSAISSEKTVGQALIIEGGIESAEEALAGEDVSSLLTSSTETGGRKFKRGPLC